jgi:hypothetical protein
MVICLQNTCNIYNSIFLDNIIKVATNRDLTQFPEVTEAELIKIINIMCEKLTEVNDTLSFSKRQASYKTTYMKS